MASKSVNIPVVYYYDPNASDAYFECRHKMDLGIIGDLFRNVIRCYVLNGTIYFTFKMDEVYIPVKFRGSTRSKSLSNYFRAGFGTMPYAFGFDVSYSLATLEMSLINFLELSVGCFSAFANPELED